jgi:hypothetical protein
MFALDLMQASDVPGETFGTRIHLVPLHGSFEAFDQSGMSLMNRSFAGIAFFRQGALGPTSAAVSGRRSTDPLDSSSAPTSGRERGCPSMSSAA